MNISLSEITREVEAIAKKAGEYIAVERQRFSIDNIETKSLNSLVSYVDRTAEEIIVKDLSALLPDAGFITEEETIFNKEADYTWVIDPLDGTTNFMHGIPCFSVSIALLHHRKPVSGVVYEINLKECFSAWKGGPAFLNGKEIKVSHTEKLQDSLLATGFPYFDYGKMDEYLELFSYLMKNTRGLRRLGSAATDLAYVAAGRFEGFYEYGLNPWDVAAGVLIVECAGGKLNDFKSGDDYLFGKELIATNGKVHNELSVAVVKCFGALNPPKS